MPKSLHYRRLSWLAALNGILSAPGLLVNRAVGLAPHNRGRRTRRALVSIAANQWESQKRQALRGRRLPTASCLPRTPVSGAPP
jgi:hypothetical protein